MPQLSPRVPDRRRRAGFSLVEVLMVLVILGIVGAALIATITRQQQFYRDTSESMVVRRELRNGAALLPTELRGVSRDGTRSTAPADDWPDIQETTERYIKFNATIGSAVICEKGGGTFTQFFVPPTNLANHTLTAWYEQPAAGDTVAIFDEGPLTGAEDDEWRYATISQVQTSTIGCVASNLMDLVQDAPLLKPRWRITIDPGSVKATTGFTPAGGLPSTIQVGAVVRFLRPVHYELYQPAGSTRWFLGYSQRLNGAWTAMAPVAGPYRAAADDGLRFQYYDTLGNATNTMREISRIDVLLKGEGERAVLRERRGTPFRDSLLFRIAVRNFK